MKKLILSIALAFMVLAQLSAKQIELQDAKTVAENFVESTDAFQAISKSDVLEIAYTSSYIDNSSNETVYYYIFNTGTKGFVIVSGDDNALPILGYSSSSTFELENAPINFRKWLEGYKGQIRHSIVNSIPATQEVVEQWNDLLGGNYNPVNKTGMIVNPLMTTTWDQSPFYNDLAPGGSVTGCVATAMAQIMKFWNHPTQGVGFHSYNENDYGTLSANFGSTTYQWSSMVDDVTSSNSAVATLMYHCGISVDMDFSPAFSGAWVIVNSPAPQANSEYAFKTYFGYDTSVQGVERENYTTTTWTALLKTELDAGRPIDYAGFGNGGGHAFVCDGYDVNDFFHMNWGWSGSFDGFFSIDALDPSGTGTGGGSGGFNSGHQAVIGIKPPAGVQTIDLKLNDLVTPMPSSVTYGTAFNVTADVLNFGGADFNGDYTVAIFDANANFIDYVETKTGLTTSAGLTTGILTFSTTGMLNMLPGSYYAGVFYRPTGGNWIIVAPDGGFLNNVPMTVVNPNDIELNSSMTVTPGTTITQGLAASVNLNVLNDGITTYLGVYSVDLYDLEGAWVEEIGTYTESTGLSAGSTYLSPFLDFSSTAITAAPGTYLLAMQHLPDGGSWELAGSTSFQNPIYVIVEGPALIPDMYEANDLETTAYDLAVTFSGNNATVLTTGSNGHNGSDNDYYQINLPVGFDYTVTARAHDSYNTGNANTYTGDVLWSYLDGATWSDVYDDVMSGPFTVSGGGIVKFHVAPYFAGETGTYLLDIGIVKGPASTIEEEDVPGEFALYPNPANGLINLVFSENVVHIGKVKIFDITGRQLMELDTPGANCNLLTIPIDNLSFGTYMVKIETEEGILTERFVKTR